VPFLSPAVYLICYLIFVNFNFYYFYPSIWSLVIWTIVLLYGVSLILARIAQPPRRRRGCRRRVRPLGPCPSYVPHPSVVPKPLATAAPGRELKTTKVNFRPVGTVCVLLLLVSITPIFVNYTVVPNKDLMSYVLCLKSLSNKKRITGTIVTD
jgi:hypothetical protein